METRIKQETQEIPADLLNLKQQFEHWRQTRTGPNNTPADLMNAAMALSEIHGITLVTRQLSLNHSALKAQKQKIKSASKQQVPKTQNRFIELASVFQQAPCQTPTLIQVHCEPGGLTIYLSSPQVSDWDNLMTGYFRAKQHGQEAR
jgi:hypothetical protein